MAAPTCLRAWCTIFTGIGLFVVAVILLFLFDGFLGLCEAAAALALRRVRGLSRSKAAVKEVGGRKAVL